MLILSRAIVVSLDTLASNVGVKMPLHSKNLQCFVIPPCGSIWATPKNLFIVEVQIADAATQVNHFNRFQCLDGDLTRFIADLYEIYASKKANQVRSTGKRNSIEDKFNERTAKGFLLQTKIFDDKFVQEPFLRK